MAMETPAKAAEITKSFYIAIPPAELAQDTALILHIVQLVNEVYTVAEEGIFDERYLRTNVDEIAKYITAGQLALASSKGCSPWYPPTNVQGCIRITRLSDTEAELAMLVASPATRGTGLGKQLMQFGEEYCRAWGAKKLLLDLLVPTTFKHKVKSWVGPWYERLGYKIVGTSDFKKAYPKISESVITETEYRKFEKVL